MNVNKSINTAIDHGSESACEDTLRMVQKESFPSYQSKGGLSDYLRRDKSCATLDVRDDQTEITTCETELSDSWHSLSCTSSSSSCIHFGSAWPPRGLWSVADDERPPHPLNIDVTKLRPHRLLGEGFFGKVWLVSERKSDRRFALKKISKVALLHDDAVHTVLREKQVMQKLHHPGIVRLHATFQDATHVQFLLPQLTGGELFDVWHAAPQAQLPERHVQFYALCLADALWYMHCQHQIVYRDLKPENIMIDESGYPVLVDFGFAKQLDTSDHKSFTLCGTSKYVSPEMVLGVGHSYTVDYWALGVVVYELVSGENPFEFWPDMDELSLYTSIAEADYLELPHGLVSRAGADFMDQLLRKKPERRLGHGASTHHNAAVTHEWLDAPEEWDLVSLRRRLVPAPWIPTVAPPTHDTASESTLDDFVYDVDGLSGQRHAMLTAKEQALFADF